MSTNPQAFTLSHLHLRQAVGYLGLALPIVVRIGAHLFEDISATESISAYYYTGMRDVFVAILVLVGALLACYRTPAVQDTTIALIAGAAAAGIGLFPMDPVFADVIMSRFSNAGSATCYHNIGFVGYHEFFVGVFFLLAFYLVSFRFSAFTPVAASAQKLKRNLIYRICGVVMLLAFATIAYLILIAKSYNIFIPESIAVMAFAVAWLVKGQAILKDPVVA
jgi:hypothetical protein